VQIHPAIRARPSGVPDHHNRILAGLPPSDLAALARHLQVVSLTPGAVLQHQDHPLEYVYFPHDGLVSLLAMASDGHAIEVASIGRGAAVCPAFKRDVSESLLTGVAQVGMRVSRIAAAHLQIVQQQSEALDRAMHACREGLLLQLRQNIVCEAVHPVEQRLLRWLLETADRLETDLMPILVTQDQVAQRLGVRRTTVTLLAGKLQEIGAIQWGRSRVEILDRARLETIACSCYADLRERMRTTAPIPA
jgi:CRP-like cAMP-binding protein